MRATFCYPFFYLLLKYIKNVQVWSCGSNYNGELGRGGIKGGSSTIYPVHMPSTVSIIQISAGRSHSMAVSDDGRLFAWGSNSHGQLAMSCDILISDTPRYFCFLKIFVIDFL